MQQVPGPRNADGVFRQLNGRPIAWTVDGVTHLCEGSDVHPGVRLIWTLCQKDVPADAAHLMEHAEAVDCPGCCAKVKVIEQREEFLPADSQFGVGA